MPKTVQEWREHRARTMTRLKELLASKQCQRCLNADMGVDRASHCGNCDCCKEAKR